MTTGVLIVLYVVGLWWCATGAILLLARRPRRTFATALCAATAVLAAATLLLRWSSGLTTIGGSCLALAAAVLIWGWLEMTFLMAAITGPRQAACECGSRGWRHLVHAVGAILYHELATLAAAGLVTALSWHAPNPTGLWTFMTLWGMRISAKLNLFLGVPNTGETMLPPHLRYLGAFFRRRALNVLFPVSVTAAMVLSVVLVSAACSTPGWDFRTAEFALLATLAVLGMIEHWMLVLPLPADAPWRALRALPLLRPKPGSVL